MTAKKKRSSVPLLVTLFLVCLAAGILFLAFKVFSPVALGSASTSAEAAESCQTKMTKMLIDETLAFNYKSTKDIAFSEEEINSWLERRLGKDRVIVDFRKDDVIFSGILTPFAAKEGGHFLRRRLADIRIAFRILAEPKIRDNRIIFEPRKIIFGKLHVPPTLMPELPKALNLNPFEKQIRTIQGVRLAEGALLVTVYAD